MSQRVRETMERAKRGNTWEKGSVFWKMTKEMGEKSREIEKRARTSGASQKEKDRLNERRKSDTVARMRNKRKGERTEAKRKRDVKNTENRREQVPLFERSLALISRRPPYKLPVCHRSWEEARYRGFFFSFPLALPFLRPLLFRSSFFYPSHFRRSFSILSIRSRVHSTYGVRCFVRFTWYIWYFASDNLEITLVL